MLSFDYSKSTMPQLYEKVSVPNTASSRETMYQWLLLQQQQEQAAALRQLSLPQAQLHQRVVASSLGLGAFPSSLAASSFSVSHPSLLPTSAADLSRQHLIQSVIAANEQRQLLEHRNRMAIQEQLSFYQRRQDQARLVESFNSSSSTTASLHSAAATVPYVVQDTPASNVQVKAEDLSFRTKRTFDEMDQSTSEHSKAEEEGEAESSEQDPPQEVVPQERPPKVPSSSKPKKFSPRKYTKADDAFLKKEPKKDTKWLQMYEELKEYKAKHGNCIVTRGYAPNPRLASWVAEQRKQYKLLCDGKPTSITEDRVNKLKELDFAWNAQEAAWTRHMNDLKAFKEEHGHCHVPLSHTMYPKLGLWVKEQRRHYTLMQQGKPSHMTEVRAAQLEASGFCWDTHEATWMERLRQLEDYKNRHGDCLVPTHWGVNPKLGTWVNHQRRQYKKFLEGKPSHITEERIAALDKLGFTWLTRATSNADASTVASSSSESESDSSERLPPPRKRHRLLM